MKNINMIELKSHIDALPAGSLILDVRTPAEFQAGHVPGAQNIPVDQVEARLSELQGFTQIYIYCKAGRRAAMAAHVLEQKKMTHWICVDDGGFPDWEDAGFPISR